MTAYIADIARWQKGLPLSELVKAGFGAVNIKISHGLETGATLYPGQPDDVARVKEARANKLRLCTFHWLTGSASGTAQAKVAYDRMKALGGPAGIGHSVDAEEQEDPPTWGTWTEYAKTMSGLLGRPLFGYTGDWWWTDYFAGRNGATLVPYLWAAPNAGYLASYPGDKSTHWKAGYGGWVNLAAMQYTDKEPPFGPGVTTTIKVSKTAIRDLSIWKAATGVAW
jgi:hypothetical protein